MFRESSISVTKSIPKQTRQAHGIFFTPKNIRDAIFKVLGDGPFPTILEPSCGSGEFVLDAREKWPESQITCIDKYVNTIPEALDIDFMEFPKSKKFHLIIGNPPFYILPGTKTNIFAEFVKKCILDHLLEDGTIAFVLPKSIMNSYPECRQIIIKHLDLVHVENFDDSHFMGTQQPVLILIGKKVTCPSKRFVFQDQFISQEYLRLSEMCIVSLKSLGCVVKTGDVVWNQEKKNLRDSEGSLVFYSENIGPNHTFVPMVTKNTEKKQYIVDRNKPLVTGPAFIIARGYGTGSYKFKWAFVDSSVSFYGENHVNILKVPPQYVDRIKEAFETKIPEFLHCFLGNGALSKSELERLCI